MATILVIEDSVGQRAEVCAALNASGLFDSVIEANDGIEGLKLLLSASPDLVLCDLEMPGLDGEKLLRMRQGVGGPEGTIVTPPIDAGVLAGITRHHILKMAAQEGVTVRERAMPRDEIVRSDELFLTSSIREVLPIVSVDGQRVGDGKPGKITKQLTQDFIAYRSN